MWLGTSRMRFLIPRSVRKILKCLSGTGRCLKYKCCFAVIEVVFMPAQARAFRAVTVSMDFFVLVPLRPFKKLTGFPVSTSA